MNKVLSLIFIPLLIAGGCHCGTNKVEKNGGAAHSADFTTEHYNVTIAPDLSNRLNSRLYPKAVSDSIIVNLILDNVYPRVLNHRRSMNQLDQFHLDFINKHQITAYKINTDSTALDFGRFGSRQNERIAYIRKYYLKDKENLKSEFKRTYDKALSRHFGSDIWTYLQEGVDGTVVNRTNSVSRLGNKRFRNKYRNVLILITDGYIETGSFARGYNLSGSQVNQFRIAFQRSGEENLLKYYQQHPTYKIKAVTNPLLKDLEILVLELYDRTEGLNGTRAHPSDLEIIKLFWKDWLTRSGAKRVELRPKFASKAEAKKVIMSFLGV
ncbi:hypothetical protein [Arcticibacter sp. MXS-1]|uniref:hypothetical protein n=1 Tax=Arcticibacter sp. MXS-1 TaxID=3341726 RepID=UPI0035A926D0